MSDSAFFSKPKEATVSVVMDQDYRMRLVNYLSVPGHKERQRLLIYIAKDVHIVEPKRLISLVTNWIQMNEVCKDGKDRFFKAFPEFEPVAQYLSYTYTLTLKTPRRHNCRDIAADKLVRDQIQEMYNNSDHGGAKHEVVVSVEPA